MERKYGEKGAVDSVSRRQIVLRRHLFSVGVFGRSDGRVRYCDGSGEWGRFSPADEGTMGPERSRQGSLLGEVMNLRKFGILGREDREESRV